MNDLVLARSENKDKVLEAQKNFDRIMGEIKPFIKKRKNTSVQGQKWEIASY